MKKKVIMLMSSLLIMATIIISGMAGTGRNAYAASEDFYILDDALYGYLGNDSEVTIPEGITEIRSGAFYINKIKKVNFPDSLESIDYQAFYGCSNLDSIYIPENVSYIDSEAFSDCSNVSCIEVSALNETYYSKSNCLILKEDSTLVLGCKTSSIPAEVKYIGAYAFSGYPCSSLTIPSTVLEIWDSAFVDSSLVNLVIPASVEYINSYAFDYCTKLQSISVNKNNKVYDSRNNCNAIIETATNKLVQGCVNTTLPDSVTCIGNSAFYGLPVTEMLTSEHITSIDCFAYDGTDIKAITIPASVGYIGDYAFDSCDDVETIKVDSNNRVVDSRNNCNAIIETASSILLRGCKNTVIPNGIKVIYDSAFYRSGIKKIDIPASVERIEEDAFGRNEMEYIYIPSTVKEIEGFPFEDIEKIYVEKGSYAESYVLENYPDNIAYGNPDAAITITKQPVSATVQTGQSAVFSVTATGNGLKYQWQYRMAGTTEWKTWSGKTTASITVPYDAKKDGMGLRCIITNANGNKLTSNAVKLGYKQGFAITGNPTNVNTTKGSTASFKVTATGTGLKYQWQFMLAGKTTWTGWTGKTSATLSVPYDAKKNNMKVKCQVTDGSGNKLTSKEAVLVYTDLFEITTQPVNVTVESGHAAPFSVAVAGNGLTYQWQFKLASASGWKNWEGKTASLLKVPYDIKKNGMLVRCLITNDKGAKLTSGEAKLVYNGAAPAINRQPAGISVVKGHAGVFSIGVSGDTLSFQWQYKLAGTTTWKTWSGKTESTLKVAYDAKKDGMSVRCVVTDKNGKKVTSSAAVMNYVD